MANEQYVADIDRYGKHFVNGIGNGMGPDSGHLWPEMRLSSEEDAKAAALCCNEAFRVGYAKAQSDMRKALGIADGKGIT